MIFYQSCGLNLSYGFSAINLKTFFRSTVYELKLCTFYFWSMSIRPSVRQNGRNIAPQRVTSDFFSVLWIELGVGVLVRSSWNLFRSTVYELKLCTSYFWSASSLSFVRQNGRNIAPHSILMIYMIVVNVLSWTYLRVFCRINLKTYMDVIYMGWSCAQPLGGGVASSVFLWVGLEHSPPPHSILMI